MKNKKVFEGTLNGSSSISSQAIIEVVLKVKENLRSGIGHRSKLLYTHPNNKNKLGAIVKTITESNPNIFCPFPYRVFTSPRLPETVMRKTGEIIWRDTKFVKYSDGPSQGSALSTEEYVSMCVYFDWAEEKYAEVMCWYEIDEQAFDKTIQLFGTPLKRPERDLNKEIAIRCFNDSMPFLSDNRRIIIGNIT